MTWTRTSVVVVTVPLLVGVLQARAPLARTDAGKPPPKFEAASVKPNTSGERTGPHFRYERSQFVVVNNNLLTIIRTAWHLAAEQVIGGPAWVRSERERFDIVAKFPEGTTPAQRPLMVRALLEERFKLRTHLETRDAPIYALVMARPDRRVGPRLSATQGSNCAPVASAGSRSPANQSSDDRPCGVWQSSLGSIRGRGVEMADFADLLSFLGAVRDRPAMDRSGLTGTYDVDLR